MASTSPVPPQAVLRNRTKIDALTANQLEALRQAFTAVYGINDDRGFAYLYFFEQALMDQVAGATLPWWDYFAAAQPAIPDPYAQPSVNGAPNPLYRGPIQGIPPEQWARLGAGPMPPFTNRTPGQLGPFPSQDDVTQALDAPTFTSFSNFVEGVHDNVHVWVGGTMSEILWRPTAPSSGPTTA
jgi:tyrosinase